MEQHIHHLVTTRPLVALHLVAAILALLIGSLVVLRRKGTVNHRVLGWTWIALMALTAGTSLFIRDQRMPNLFGYSAIHLFSVSVAVLTPIAVLRARRGNIRGHAAMMRGLFIGGGVVAGLFTLLPGRFLGALLWKHTLGLIA